MGATGGGTGGYGGYGYGGAIYNNGGTVGMANCTFVSNQATGGAGGTGGHGVDAYQYWHSVPWPGTGYYVSVYGGPGGRGGDGGNGFGGSLHNASGTVTLVNVTMARGAAGGGNGGSPSSPGAYASGNYGAGYFGNNSHGGNISSASGNVTLQNTILAYGTGSPGYNSYGMITDDGNNICSDTTAGFSTTTSLNNIDPLLAAELVANGGAIMTLEVLSQSPAINAGADAAATTTGQRTSNYSWAGGFVWIRGNLGQKLLTKVIGEAKRGDNTLRVASTEQLRPGQRIEIYQHDHRDNSLAEHLYAGDAGDTKNLRGSTRASLVCRITKVEGDRISFERPLRFDVKPQWQPQIRSFAPSVSEVGVENLGFEFPNIPYQGHFTEMGNNR